MATFLGWLAATGQRWNAVTADELADYREWLASRYARTTTNRRLVVVRGLFAEARRRGLLLHNPAEGLRSLRGRDDRDGGALTRQQARDVLDAILADVGRPPRRLRALRDHAIVALLLRTGLRRSELAGIRIGDLGQAQGHSVLTIMGKGAVLRTVKVPPELRRVLDEWLDAATSADMELTPEGPLFVEVRKGGRNLGRLPLSDRAVYDVVATRLRAAGVERLGPHGLRATFVTLALEGGAPLHLVQRAAGHADPRTTERYWRRKTSLDDNAVDYVRL